MRDPVAALLEPRSVAVVGASNDPLKRGYQAIRRLQAEGFPGPIYPVNPRTEEVLGLPSFPSLEAIEDEVDLALLVTPAVKVVDLLEACGRKGVSAVVVIAVGFGETGEEGRRLEEEVARVAAEHGIRLVGPNTNGVFNLNARLNLVGTSDVPRGPVALVCQSGNMAQSLFSDAAHGTTVGFDTYVGIGNEAGVRYHELLAYLHHDPNTEAVIVYAEGFRDGRAFLQTAAELSRSKPLVIYKAGRSEAAQRSALSHTGAIAGSAHVATSALRQAGAVVVERSDELVPVCDTLLRQPPMRAPRVAVLADGGGHATVAADALEHHGLELAELSPATCRRLAELLPSAAATRNPVDVAGATDRDPELFAPCIDALFDDPQVEGVLVVGLFGGYGMRFSGDLSAAEERAAHEIVARARERDRPLVVQSAYFHSRPPAHEILRAGGVPMRSSVEISARAMAALWERGRMLSTSSERSTMVMPGARRAATEVRALTEPEGRQRLLERGLPVGPWEVATDADAAADTVARLTTGAALKIVSEDVVHKSDVGGVVLDVRTPDDARRAFERMVARVRAAQPGVHIQGVLVTPMAPRGIELIVGATTDPTFGPILTVGAGGVAVEALEDVAFRAAPVTPLECHEMLDELAIAPLLAGHRGSTAVDREAIVDLLLGVSRLVQDDPEIVELDLNPVVVHHDGIELVDVRVVVAASERGGTTTSKERQREVIVAAASNA